mmetsp:Transcript_20177/g.64461  ORF Transcript_20177/g.64461 Transcript_20177/m.64461 type:complete len:238 (+) Transcript_20177:722-1435(+)
MLSPRIALAAAVISSMPPPCATTFSNGSIDAGATPLAFAAVRTASGRVHMPAASAHFLVTSSESRPCSAASERVALSVGASRLVPASGRETVAPTMKAWSRGSMLDEMKVAASASVRAMMRVGVPRMSACSRAALSRSACSCVGTSTLPPMWPHFLVPGDWSSKWIPAAPASTNILVSFMTAVRPPWPVSPSATMGVIMSGTCGLADSRHSSSHSLRSWCCIARKSWSHLLGTVSIG